MKRRYGFWVLILLVIAIPGGLIWHFTRPKPLEVVVRPVERGTVEQTVANTRVGTVNACRRAKLSPSVGGQIAVLPIREGDRVRAGTLLLELWNDDLEAEVVLAKREVDVARARARAACLKADVAKREADRLVKLRSTGAASEQTKDQAVTGAKALRADCEASNASVFMRQARVGEVQTSLARTRLLAPFDGVVAEINGEVFEYLTPSPPGIPTPPAVDLIDDACFYVTAPIDEVDASEIVKGMIARITLDALGDRRLMGKVRRIAPYVLDREKQARTVDVEVAFEDADDFQVLLAGYSVDVEIILDVRKQTLRIPTEAVLDGQRVFVYVPDEGIIREQTFTPGISNWDHTEVVAGLNEDDRVVVNVDQAGVEDGARAVIVREK